MKGRRVATTYAEATVPGAAGRRARASVRERLVSPMPDDRLRGWLMSLLVTLIAAGMRLNRLSKPPSEVFDEVYYRKDSHDLWRWAVERNAEGKGPGYIVHPPLGKWMIGWSQRALDWDNQRVYVKALKGEHAAFSWRLGAAVLGVLTVLVVCRLGRRLFRSTPLGCFAGLLMALDGLHFVQSRAVMLDIAILFWTVVAAACLLADRDDLRRRLADRLEAATDGLEPSYPGPRTGVRWWRIATGISIGLACGVKWSGAYLIPVFVLVSFGWEIGARRVAGIPSPVRAAFRRSAVPMVATLMILPVIAYLGTWAGWFITMDGWRRDCGRPGPWSGMKHPKMCGPVAGLWQYHAEALKFHNGLSSPHAYQSHTWGWLLLARPVSYFYNGATPGFSRHVLAIGTPAIWWGSIFALGATFWRWISTRDWRAAFILAGFAATYLPWFWSDMNERTMFLFYALPALPFMCLALTYCAGLAVGSRTASSERRFWGAAISGVYLLIVLANFYFMYPVLSGKIIPYGDWKLRMWFSSWV
ncbi:MAG: phospholipid carrier-dependent glycosyltransferase [Mycobacteriales bacterium]